MGAMLWALARQRPGDLLHPGKLIVGLYFFMSLASLFFSADLAPSFSMNVTWARMFGYTALLCITLIPIFIIDRPDGRRVVGHKLVPSLFLWSSPLILFSFIYLMPFAISVIYIQGFAATRYNLNSLHKSVLPETFFTTMAVATSSYYIIFALLLFVALVRKMGMIRIIIAAVGVGLVFVHAAVFGARDGVVWAVPALLLGLWVVSPGLRPRTRHRVAVAIILLISLGIVYMSLATKDRFADSTGGYASGTVGYFGSQPYVFSETVDKLTLFYGPANRFPLVAQFYGGQEVRRVEVFQWSFGTFLTDFYSVAGWPSVILLSFAFTIMTTGGLLWCKHRSALAYTLAVAMYSQFMIQGVFYYRLGNLPGNLYHISIIILISMIAIFFPDRSPVRKSARWPGVPGSQLCPDKHTKTIGG